MIVMNCKYFFIPRNYLHFYNHNKSLLFRKSNIHTFQYTSKPSSYLYHTQRKFPKFSSVIHASRINFKALNSQLQVVCLFRTSAPRNIPAVVWLVLRPILKFAAVVTGRGIRKWWKNLPKDKKQYFINEIKANRRKIGIALSLILGLSVTYYLSHLESTPITNRKRFMAFNPKQIEQINRFELDMLMQNFGSKLLPHNHPTTIRVQNVVRRIIAANADIKEFEGKEFGVSVVDSSVENAFVIPLGHVFVFSGMLNLCSNDDQLGTILSHEIAHCILNHGAENVSFAHLLDMISIVIIAAIWAVIPIDSFSVLMHWLYQKSIKIFLELPYSRKTEMEADYVGLQLAAKSCFDVRESSAFWCKMAFLTKTFGNGPEIEFLSTHPSHEKRSESLDNIMDQAVQLRTLCGCPKLNWRDPRLHVEAVNKAIELQRRQFFEQNKKPVDVIKMR